MDWNPEYLYRPYFKDDDMMNYFLGNVCTTQWNNQFDYGITFAEGVKNLQEKFPQFKDAIQAYDDRWLEMLKGAIAPSVELLYDLKKRNYKLYGLTNWSSEKIRLVLPQYEFFKEFDGIVISGDEKVAKPDKKIYEILLTRYNLTPSECVFIDDNLSNINVAQSLGINAVHFDNFENAKARLLKKLLTEEIL